MKSAIHPDTTLAFACNSHAIPNTIHLFIFVAIIPDTIFSLYIALHNFPYTYTISTCILMFVSSTTRIFIFYRHRWLYTTSSIFNFQNYHYIVSWVFTYICLTYLVTPLTNLLQWVYSGGGGSNGWWQIWMDTYIYCTAYSRTIVWLY